MSHIIRHDTITLRKGANKDDFERFIKDELFPIFSEVYQGPTRTSKADLKSQSHIKDAKGVQYIWTSVWTGSPEAVSGVSFENTRMTMNPGMHKAEEMLEKLDSFGKRSIAKIYNEIFQVEVPTNK